MVIEGRTEFSQTDFTAAARNLPWLTLFGRLALLFVLINVLPVLFSDERPPLGAWLVPPIFMALILLLGMGVSRYAWAANSFREAVGAGPREVAFRLSAEGFELDSTLRRIQLAWPAIARVTETKESFLVFMGERSVLVAPFRAFSSEDLRLVRRTFEQHVTVRPRAQVWRLTLLWLVVVIASLAMWQFLHGAQPP